MTKAITNATELKQLRREVRALTNGAPQSRRYPADLRRRLTAFMKRELAAGVAATKLCAALDVGLPTLHRFLGRVAPRPPASSFTLLPVVNDVVASPPLRLEVHGPFGVTVHGDVHEVALLLKALSCLG